MISTLHTTILAASQEQPQGPEFGKASPLGLLIIILLLIGTALLIWSMNRQLKKLPKSFDTDHPEADQAFDEGTDFDGHPDSAGATGPDDASSHGVGSHGANPNAAAPVFDKGMGDSAKP